MRSLLRMQKFVAACIEKVHQRYNQIKTKCYDVTLNWPSDEYRESHLITAP